MVGVRGRMHVACRRTAQARHDPTRPAGCSRCSQAIDNTTLTVLVAKL